MESRYNKFLFSGFLMLGLSLVLGFPYISLGATANVTVGCTTAQCGGGIGFVDDASGTGGFAGRAATSIATTDTVHWHWEAGGIHTVSSGATAPGPCGTGDTFDTGILPAPGSVFDHTFNTAGTCSYFCNVHSAGLMAGDVNVGGGGTTQPVPTTTTSSTIGGGTTPPTTTSSTVATTTPPTTTTTSSTIGGPTTTTTIFNPNPTTIVGTSTTIRQTTTTIRSGGGDGRGGGFDGRGGFGGRGGGRGR